MGEHQVGALDDDRGRRAFEKALLDDVRALERMLSEGLIESGARRIGAEQEYFLVYPDGQAAPVAQQMLERIEDPAFTTEIALFNLEANLPPYTWGGNCLRKLESDLNVLLAEAREAAAACGADVLLTGILPTLKPSDLSPQNMTPAERYRALNDAMMRQRGGSVPIRIKGIDEFYTVADSVMLEGCNTSFQIHFQVSGDEFPRLYNAAQVAIAPLLAGAVNSPVLLERRLWEETRVALFQSSVDDRSGTQRMRGQRPRVSFGDRWIRESVLEIFREDIARFRVVLGRDVGENSLEALDNGRLPDLRALCLHNGTVWRWNRACYGVSGGKAHLRIENRVLPAGPSVLDQVANAAFYYGLLVALLEEYGDVTNVISFDAAKTNFMAAARRGLRAQFSWMDGESTTARHLILERLLPMAREALLGAGIDSDDVARYIGVYRERVRTGRTGAEWMNESLARMGSRGTPHARHRMLTVGSLTRQRLGNPVHMWSLADLEEEADQRGAYQVVGQFMTRDVFTVGPYDVMDLAVSLMQWKHIRHVPVEDADGRLVGLVSHRDLLNLLMQRSEQPASEPPAIKHVMRRQVLTVAPGTPTLEAIRLMREHGVGCLPVVKDAALVGIVTERDFLEAAGTILERHLHDPPPG